MSVPEATTRDETVVFFPAGDETLFGILTRPVQNGTGTGVVLLPEGGYHTPIHMDALLGRFSRRLAGEGYYAMRFDYHGVGQSTGRIDEYRVDAPFVEDLEGAVREMRREGVDRIVAVGLCFGGRTALSWAEGAEAVDGVILVAAPLGEERQGEGPATRRAAKTGLLGLIRHGFRLRVLRRFLTDFREQAPAAWQHLRVGFRLAWRRQRARWRRESTSGGLVTSPTVIRPLKRLAARGVPVLFVYGSEDPFLRHFEGSLGDFVKRAAPLIQIETLDGIDKPVRAVATQEATIDIVREWISRRGRPTRQEVIQGSP